MKRLTSYLLALLLTVSPSISVLAAGIEDAQVPTTVTAEPAEVQEISEPSVVSGPDSPQPVGRTIELKALDVTAGMASINDDNHLMPTDKYITNTVALEEDGTLPADIADKAPAMAGWEFAGWYTAPVKYAFWGDYTGSGYAATEPLPFEHDCDGNEYDFTEKDPNALHSLTAYWRWLSTLEDSTGTKVEAGTSLSEDVTALYALYTPTTIHYTMDYRGWSGRTGALDCGRQYGTPFGDEDVDVNGWSGYVFDGWYAENSDVRMSFYSIPANNVRYVAHWHSEDGRVNWENYQEQGLKPVTSLVMKDLYNKDIGSILQLHAGSGLSQTIYVSITPADSGVSTLTWDTSDETVATVEVLDNGTRATIRSTDKAGTAVVTVKSANGCYDSVIVDTQGHSWGKSTVTQWGNCERPTITVYTCVYCGATEQRKSYSRHQYGYREIAATCTTPCIWEHYCKVCGNVDSDGNITRGAALGHSFLTTTTSGCGGTVTTNTCSRCGLTQTSNDNIGVHNWSPTYTVDVRPTCHSEGSQSIKCLDCGIIQDGSSTPIPADPSLHVWGDWSVTVEPGEDIEGLKIRVCETCGQEDQRVIPPTNLEVDTDKLSEDLKTSNSASDEVADQEQAAGTLDNTLSSLLSSGNNSMLADDLLYALIQGKGISTEIRVTPVAAPESDADAEKFKALLGSALVSVSYMDIDIFVMADGMNIGRITETDDDMTFSVALPAGGRIVNVLRAHEGEVEPISCWIENNMVYFTTNKFSTFAVSVNNDISLAEVEAIGDQSYTGSEIKPAVKVTINNGDSTLAEGTDYTLSYRDNVDAGTATVTITGIGDFEGTTKEVTFRIIKSEPAPDPAPDNTAPSEEPADNAPSGTATAPKTGDESHLALWMTLFLLSCAAMTTAMVLKRRA